MPDEHMNRLSNLIEYAAAWILADGPPFDFPFDLPAEDESDVHSIHVGKVSDKWTLFVGFQDDGSEFDECDVTKTSITRKAIAAVYLDEFFAAYREARAKRNDTVGIGLAAVKAFCDHWEIEVDE